MRITALDHIVLRVTDVDRMVRFYTTALGLEALRLAEYSAGDAPFPSLRINETTIVDLFPPAMRDHEALDSGGTLDHFCVVADATMDTIRENLQREGVTVERGPVSAFGARGEGCSVYVRDPEHNLIEIRTYAPVNEDERPAARRRVSAGH